MANLSRNRSLRFRFPIDAPLERLIDWGHPLLRDARGDRPGERLLDAWRRRPGYRFFFDRRQLPGILQEVPGESWRNHQAGLDWLLGRSASARPFVPRTADGRFNWHCNSRTNSEYVCHVNRFSWIVGLSAAARREGPAAAEAVLSLMDGWLEDCPMPPDALAGPRRAWRYGYHPWGVLQAALRLKHWMFALHLLWDSEALTPERFGRYIHAFRRHVFFIGRVSPRTWPGALHNHFLMEAEAMLYGSLWPWLIESEAARAVALHNLARCVHRQILADGVQREVAPGYHRGCMQWFAMPLLICKLNGIGLPDGAADRVGSMLDFGLHSISPDGSTSRFGDTGAGRDGYQSERLVGRLTRRRLPIQPDGPRGLLAFLPNLPKLDGAASRPLGLARHFPHGGYAIARTSWRPDASHLMIKLDSYGGGHSHADFLSFTFTLAGRMIVDEAGTRGYDNDRACVACKLTAAHNVLMVGRREMVDPADRTRYWVRRRPIVKIRDLFCTTGRDGSLHAGGVVLWPDGAWWRREFLFDPAGRLQIRDHVHNPAGQRVRLLLHLASVNVRADGDGGFRTEDAGRPNAIIRVQGEPGASGRLTPADLWHGFFNAVPGTLLTIEAGRARSGCWQTVIARD